MWNRFLFFLEQLSERLWVRPLVFCILSVGAALIAKAADGFHFATVAPEIAPESIETLLSITAASMLVIATLAVASMVSAYASASSNATPRSFSLLVSDDVSQNALSTFMGAFIYTFVALIALKNDYYQQNGTFVLFVMTVAVVALVIVTFVRWVDWIARLGRIGTTIDLVEAAGIDAFKRRRSDPRLGGSEVKSDDSAGVPVYAESVGYVQHINVEALNECAEEHGFRVVVDALPGGFIGPGRPLARIQSADLEGDSDKLKKVRSAFEIGRTRSYGDDPRFALIALSEIASRALSPAVNDPGTAISIFGSFVRMFTIWAEPLEQDEQPEIRFEQVSVPELSTEDMMDDAFRAIARDGAGNIELQLWLQKTLKTIAAMPSKELRRLAQAHSRAALSRAQAAMEVEQDAKTALAAAKWSAD